ncbi:MAG: M20/M25/M40 family metallo-hydrolase, partial [Candidatus Omnitrophota bacterium]
LRFLPGMKADVILSGVRKAFDKTGVRYRLEIQDIQQPYEISRNHPLVRALKVTCSGRRCRIQGSEGATVITFFKKKNIPAVATGYGSSGCAHATDEYVAVADIARGALALERFLKIFKSKVLVRLHSQGLR